MTYTVTFYNIALDREDFSIFQDIEHARDFIKTRHDGYGSKYKIIEESEDGSRSAIVK